MSTFDDFARHEERMWRGRRGSTEVRSKVAQDAVSHRVPCRSGHQPQATGQRHTPPHTRRGRREEDLSQNEASGAHGVRQQWLHAA